MLYRDMKLSGVGLLEEVAPVPLVGALPTASLGLAEGLLEATTILALLKFHLSVSAKATSKARLTFVPYQLWMNDFAHSMESLFDLLYSDAFSFKRRV